MTKGLKMSELSVAPDSPTSGKRLIYPKSDGWYGKNAAGVEQKITGADTLGDLTDVNLTSIADGQILEYDSTDSEFKNVNPPNFGKEFDYVNSYVSDSNGTTTYETYLTKSMYFAANYEYLLNVGVSLAMSSSSYDWEGIITIDGTPIGTMQEELKDPGQDQNVARSMHFVYSPTTTGNKAVVLGYRPENTSATAYINYGIITKWRIQES